MVTDEGHCAASMHGTVTVRGAVPMPRPQDARKSGPGPVRLGCDGVMPEDVSNDGNATFVVAAVQSGNGKTGRGNWRSAYVPAVRPCKW